MELQIPSHTWDDQSHRESFNSTFIANLNSINLSTTANEMKSFSDPEVSNPVLSENTRIPSLENVRNIMLILILLTASSEMITVHGLAYVILSQCLGSDKPGVITPTMEFPINPDTVMFVFLMSC